MTVKKNVGSWNRRKTNKKEVDNTESKGEKVDITPETHGHQLGSPRVGEEK